MTETKLLTEGIEPELTTQEVKVHKGGTRIALRNSSGMFVAAPKAKRRTLSETQAAILLKLTDEDEDGNTPLEKILDNTIKNASQDAEQPLLDKHGAAVLDAEGKPLTYVCAKTMMASAKAADTLLKAAQLPHTEQQQLNRVEIINVSIPPEVLNAILARQGTVTELVPHATPTQPAFAEVVDVRTNFTKVAPASPKPTLRTGPSQKNSVEVSWLMSMTSNAKAVELAVRGLTVAAVKALAENELPIRMTSSGVVTQGILRLASAYAWDSASIMIDIEQQEV